MEPTAHPNPPRMVCSAPSEKEGNQGSGRRGILNGNQGKPDAIANQFQGTVESHESPTVSG